MHKWPAAQVKVSSTRPNVSGPGPAQTLEAEHRTVIVVTPGYPRQPGGESQRTGQARYGH